MILIFLSLWPSTAAFALSNSSSKEWFLDSKALPQRCSLVSRACDWRHFWSTLQAERFLNGDGAKMCPRLTRRDLLTSNILAWVIPWTEEPGELQSWDCRVRHNWTTEHTHTHAYINTCKHVYVCIYVYVCIQKYVYIYTSQFYHSYIDWNLSFLLLACLRYLI